MNFNDHSKLAGSHAYLSASQHAWLNYDEAKIDASYRKNQAARIGTELHALAAELIKRRIKLPDTGATMNSYVNDAIGFRMSPEVVLVYSANCYGTADAIYFDEDTMTLRVHDLKTGENDSPFAQLEIYVAMFCLEYHFKPNQLKIELRIYQNDDVKIHIPEADRIYHIMDKIMVFDGIIEEIREELSQG